MKKLSVSIEISGSQVEVGSITGSNYEDACFRYSSAYLSKADNAPISISLPRQEETFSCDKTRNFFEGLLPEGFTRRSVAQVMHVDEKDYISILSGLGRECLGAIKITEENSEDSFEYERLSNEQVKELARDGASKSVSLITKAHLSLTGASGKVGLYYDENSKEWYLPIGSAPSTHIVKQSHIRLKGIVTNEQLSLQTASKLGIDIPDTFIINTGSNTDEDILLATRRYDREFGDEANKTNGMRIPYRLHQEDFAQALGIASSDKYEKSDENYLTAMFELLKMKSSSPVEDSLKLWDIIAFDFLIGNTDNHIKNLSLLYSRDLRRIRLAPAYDIVSTTIYEGSSRDMAMAIGGNVSIDAISRASFQKAAEMAGINKKTAMSRLDNMCSRFDAALSMSAEELMDNGFDKANEIADAIRKTGGMAKMK